LITVDDVIILSCCVPISLGVVGSVHIPEVKSSPGVIVCNYVQVFVYRHIVVLIQQPPTVAMEVHPLRLDISTSWQSFITIQPIVSTVQRAIREVLWV
jgi:hypothetical protein